jgi:hypothetical protein
MGMYIEKLVIVEARQLTTDTLRDIMVWIGASAMDLRQTYEEGRVGDVDVKGNPTINGSNGR